MTAASHKPPGKSPLRYLSSLRTSWKEGIAAAMMSSVTDYYVIPLGLFLGASPAEIGLLVAIPNLLGSISQLLSVSMVRLMGSRLKFLVKGTALQAAILVPMALLPVVHFSHKVELLIFCMTLFRVIGNLIGTVWGSLTSDYLPPEQRGSYFGWRSQIAAFAGITGMIAGGTCLYLFKKISAELAFLILFLAVSFARGVSSWLMAKMEDVPISHNPESDFTFLKFLRRFRESNFVKFVFFVSAITFATNLAAPYFSVYLLRNLQVNYLVFTTVHLAAIAGSLISFPLWGKHADQFGNAKVLKVTGWLIPWIPVLWALAPNVTCIIIIEMFSGFIWGGFNLCAANYIFDAVSSEKRVRCFAYFSLINGVAIFFGASLGGLLAENLPPFRGSSLAALFLLSGFFRFLSNFALSKHFREVRASATKVSNKNLLFSVVGIRPLFGRANDWNLITFIKKSSWW